jgi:hypothetical protein
LRASLQGKQGKQGQANDVQPGHGKTPRANVFKKRLMIGFADYTSAQPTVMTLP